MTLLHGDCVEVIRSMPEDSVDAVVTDPPYFLHFMGRSWDKSPSPSEQQRQHQAWAREALRVLKPGGFLLASGGTRTVHRLTCAIEDAGFEIRDSITWIYGSGFPKSLDVSKAIDKMAGAEREVVGKNPNGRSVEPLRFAGDNARPNLANNPPNLTASATEAAKQWEGFGTALKPAFEPIVVARKPLSESSVARNVLEHGTGALNIDASRIPGGKGNGNWTAKQVNSNAWFNTEGVNKERADADPSGRWPANVILSHSPECQRVGVKRVRGGTAIQRNGGGQHIGGRHGVYSGAVGEIKDDAGYADPDGFETTEAWECVEGCPVAELDRQSGNSKSVQGKPRAGQNGNGWGMTATGAEYSDQGGASRFFKTFEEELGFFYCAKSSRSERNAFTKSLPRTKNKRKRYQQDRSERWLGRVINRHPTIKPLALMRYLVKLVTPPGGVVLDPFAGSGSTLVAAIQEGFEAVGIEREQEYLEIAERRVAHARAEIESQPLMLEV